MVNPSKYPGTHTYINLLNIQRASEFAKKEASITSLRSFELLQEPTIILQTFDLKHLKSIHYHLFQDLFKWAGKIRSFDMQKGRNTFTPYNEIETFFQVVADAYAGVRSCKTTFHFEWRWCGYKEDKCIIARLDPPPDFSQLVVHLLVGFTLSYAQNKA